MNGLYLQYERLWKVQKKEEGNCICIVDRNHERSVVVLDYFRNLNGIQLIVITISKMEEYLSREREINVRN